MAIELTMRRTLGGLRPTDAMGEEALNEYPIGADLKIKATKGRHPVHHRKFMALLHAVYEHQDTWPTFDLFRRAVQRACGFSEVVNDQVFDVSIAWSKMDQAEFEELYKKAVHLIQTRIIPGVDSADLQRQVDEILAGRNAA